MKGKIIETTFGDQIATAMMRCGGRSDTFLLLYFLTYILCSNAHENRGRNDDNIRNFNVFTDPLEMHRYFEHQMDEMLKSFGGFFGSDNFFGFNAQIPSLAPPESQFPSVEQPPENDNLRARLLKPGYENRDYSKRDQVIDDRVIHAGDLDELLKEKGPTYRKGVDEDGVVSPYQRKPILPQIRSFGQSMSSKTIRRPDGTTEIHKTVRDSSGNEETVVTRQMGDKQYTVTVRTDKEGRQETCEEFINMDEQELPKFKDYWSQGNLPQNDGTNNTVDDINKLFPFFDKFFK